MDGNKKEDLKDGVWVKLYYTRETIMLNFKFPKNAPLKFLKDIYCGRYDLPENYFGMKYGFHVISDEDTLTSIGWENHGIIEVFRKDLENNLIFMLNGQIIQDEDTLYFPLE